MLLLDLNPIENVVTPLYPPIGKVVERQMKIFRSFVLKKHMKVPLNNWVDKLVNHPVLHVIARFIQWNIPQTSQMQILARLVLRPSKRKLTTSVGLYQQGIQVTSSTILGIQRKDHKVSVKFFN